MKQIIENTARLAVSISLLILAFFGTYASAANGSYECTASSTITVMPLLTVGGTNGAWIAGLGGSGALAHCSVFFTDEGWDPNQPQGTSVSCILTTFSQIAGGDYDYDTAHYPNGLLLQMSVPEDFFVIDCSWIFRDF